MRRKCAGTTNVFGAAPASNAACVAASQFGASASARRRVSRNGVRYRPDEAPLPKVVCAGMDDVAKEIRAAAVREGVPLMENVELARALYAQVKNRGVHPRRAGRARRRGAQARQGDGRRQEGRLGSRRHRPVGGRTSRPSTFRRACRRGRGSRAWTSRSCARRGARGSWHWGSRIRRQSSRSSVSSSSGGAGRRRAVV